MHARSRRRGTEVPGQKLFNSVIEVEAVLVTIESETLVIVEHSFIRLAVLVERGTKIGTV